MLSCLREAFGRIVILPYWLTFSRRPTVLLLNSAFCILNSAFKKKACISASLYYIYYYGTGS